MKNLSLIAVLLFTAIPAFTQTKDEYVIQGAWIGKTPNYEFTMFIFGEDTFFFILDGFHTGKYIIKDDNKIILKLGWRLWPSADEWEREDGDGEIQCAFSADKLILIFDDIPIVYSKASDIPLSW